MNTSIDTLVPRERLHEILFALSSCLGMPVQLLGEKGQILQRHGDAPLYCRMLQKHIFTAGECAKAHLNAGRHACTLGESYIFSCKANLNHIAFPLVSHNTLLGTVLVGPFLMDEADSTLITDLAAYYTLPPDLCLELYDELKQLPVTAPVKVNQISKLMSFLFAPLLTDERRLMLEKQEKIYQQSRINETIQMYKGVSLRPSGYPYEKERELLVKVKTRDMSSAKAILNDLLGYVLLSEGQQIEVIKSRALELTALLSRVAIEGGAPTEHIHRLNHQFLTRLRQLNQFEALCYQLQEIVEGFINSVSLPANDAGSAPIREAVRYIAGHYHQSLTLDEIAKVAGLSPAYFSTLFTQVMRVNYREYLSRVRMEQAKHLLSATDYPLSQIAISVGYADQSSFTKAFKRTTGLTPHQYR